MDILIVEDEKPISNLIDLSLRDAGYNCTCVFDGMAAADILEHQNFDLILLDIMLPKIDGYELMKYIKTIDIPTIFLTAKASTADKVKGLHLGADDYLAKPFEIVELLARVESVLRRYHKRELQCSIGGLEIDQRAHTVRKNGEMIGLTIKEYEILLLFIQNPHIALFRETIYERVWGSELINDTRTVDLHVQRLRKKIGWNDKIQAVYKVGYRLEV